MILNKFEIMNKVLTVRCVIFNSFLVIMFAACGVNSQKKATICSNLDSDMFVAEEDFAKNKIKDDSHPMVLSKSDNFEKESHPMVISPCLKPQD